MGPAARPAPWGRTPRPAPGTTVRGQPPGPAGSPPDRPGPPGTISTRRTPAAPQEGDRAMEDDQTNDASVQANPAAQPAHSDLRPSSHEAPTPEALTHETLAHEVFTHPHDVPDRTWHRVVLKLSGQAFSG